MSIYIDVIWLLNLLFDALLLLLTGIFLKRKIIIWRLIAGALLGSIIVILMVTPFSFYVSHPFIKLLFSLFMIWVSFGFKRFRYFVQNLLTFYFVTFLMGGGIIAIHFFLNRNIGMQQGIFLTNKTGLGDPISWILVLIGFPFLWFFSRTRIDELKYKKITYNQIVNVTIRIDDATLKLRGLIDSGNQLYEPITKSPVMIINIEKASDILPKRMLELSANINTTLETFEIDHIKWENRIRIIPYRAVGQEHQFLLGIKPDEISIFYEEKWLNVKKGLVALNHVKLSTDDEYDCIVHPKMISEGVVKPAI